MELRRPKEALSFWHQHSRERINVRGQMMYREMVRCCDFEACNQFEYLPSTSTSAKGARLKRVKVRLGFYERKAGGVLAG
jgi:hypothetical protein